MHVLPPPPTAVAWSLVSSIVMALAGWTYFTNSRVSTLEAQQAAVQQQLHDIHDDVRDLRNSLLGPKGAYP